VAAAELNRWDGRLELHFYYDTGTWTLSSKVRLLPTMDCFPSIWVLS